MKTRPQSPQNPSQAPILLIPLPTPAKAGRRPQSARIAKLRGAGGVGCSAAEIFLA
jgi:hypothetical protein